MVEEDRTDLGMEMEFVLGIDSVTVIGGGGRYEFDNDSYVFNWQRQNAIVTGVEINEILLGTLSLNDVAVTAGQFVAVSDWEHLAWEAPGKPKGVVEAIEFTIHGTGSTGELVDEVPNIASFEYDYFDLIRGTSKSELIDGTNTRDTLDGGAGNDKLRGRRLDDHFVFKTGYDKDTILDGEFNEKRFGADETDMIDLSGLKSVKSYTDLMKNHVEVHLKDVWIDGGNGDILILKNTDIHDLDKGDFMF